MLEETAVDRWPRHTLPYSLDGDPGSSNTGMYELAAVLTHKGRSSNVGHYVGWIRKGKAWFACDDDRVYPVTSDDVEKLSGGGDWHTAYLLLYAPKQLVIIDEPKEQSNGDTPMAEATPANGTDKH